MQIGMIGLGRMGANMALRLAAGGHEVYGYDPHPPQSEVFVKAGVQLVTSVADMVKAQKPPRAVWVMVPAGAATESALFHCAEQLARGDVLIDGGNSFYKDDVRRGQKLAEAGIHLVDVGTSGGVYGRERGYSLMIGSDKAIFSRLEPLFRTLAPGRGDTPRTPSRVKGPATTAEEGYLHCGPTGSGHFVKMVHNGIEYGMMEAMAEGFAILRNAASHQKPEDLRFKLNLAEIAEVWRRGSVVSSWLLDLTADALTEDQELEDFTGRVQDSGEGRWTVQEAVETSVPCDVLAASLFARFRSRLDESYSDKVLSAMRFKFGGHGEAQPHSD